MGTDPLNDELPERREASARNVYPGMTMPRALSPDHGSPRLTRFSLAYQHFTPLIPAAGRFRSVTAQQNDKRPPLDGLSLSTIPHLTLV